MVLAASKARMPRVAGGGLSSSLWNKRQWRRQPDPAIVRGGGGHNHEPWPGLVGLFNNYIYISINNVLA